MFNTNTFGFCDKIKPTNANYAVASIVDITISWDYGYGFQLSMYGPEISHEGSRDRDIAENIKI